MRANLGVELPRVIKSIWNAWIIGTGVRALHSFGETQRDPFIFLQVRGNERIDLPGVWDRRDIAELQSGSGINSALDASPAVSLNAREIEIHQLRNRDLLCPDRSVDLGDGRLLEPKLLALRCARLRR